MDKPFWVGVAESEGGVGPDAMDWNFGAAWSTQWAHLQPDERRQGGQVTCAPTEKMSWGNRMNGRRLGMRVLVIGLLLWGDAGVRMRGGTTNVDWEMAAADVVHVLRVREQQLKMEHEKAASDEGGKGAGDKRKQSANEGEVQGKGKASGNKRLKR